MTTTMSASGGSADDAAQEFVAHLKALFAAAGNPTLAATVAAVGSRVTVAALSHWRTGRHLPAHFATIEPVLVWLTARAMSRQQYQQQSGQLATLRTWARLFERATTTDPHRRDVLHTAATAQALTASFSSDVFSCIAAQLTDIDAHGNIVCATMSTTQPEPVRIACADLHSAGVIAEHLATRRWTWAYEELLTEWPHLADWIGDHYHALTARTALIDDATRWHRAGRPAHQLYGHHRLTTVGEALAVLPEPANRSHNATDATRWFGPARHDQIPTEAIEFWTQSQRRAAATLRTHKAILTTIFALIVTAIIISGVVGAMLK